MAWTQSLLILKDGGRICADSPMEEDPVSAIGGGVGHGVFSLVEMQLLGGCSMWTACCLGCCSLRKC